MAAKLSAESIALLNDLWNRLPEFGKPAGAENMLLGDVLADIEAASPDGLIASLRAAAVAVGTADVVALGIVTVTAITAAASTAVVAANAADNGAAYVEADVDSIGTLANANKVAINALVTEVADLRARAAEVDTAVASLATTVASLRTLANDVKARHNTLQAGIDAIV